MGQQHGAVVGEFADPEQGSFTADSKEDYFSPNYSLIPVLMRDSTRTRGKDRPCHARLVVLSQALVTSPLKIALS